MSWCNSLGGFKIFPNAISPDIPQYPSDSHPLEKGNNTYSLFRKTDNTRIPWKRSYSVSDKKSISLPFLGTRRTYSQRSLQFVIPIFLPLCRTLTKAACTGEKGFENRFEYSERSSPVFSTF